MEQIFNDLYVKNEIQNLLIDWDAVQAQFLSQCSIMVFLKSKVRFK